MKVSNIDINDFITLLLKMKKAGNVMVDIEITKEDDKDKLIIYPVKVLEDDYLKESESKTSDITINNPHINTEDDSILDMFKNIS